MVQVDELRMRVRELEERERKESKKLADEDALRKIRVAEETIEHLQKKLAATKQVCVCVCGWCGAVQCSAVVIFSEHFTLTCVFTSSLFLFYFPVYKKLMSAKRDA